MGEAILSAFLQVVFDRLASRELIDVAHQWKINSELKKLERTLLKIKVVLNDAEEKQIKNDAIKMWLNDLNHVAYDAEDVLDEFAIEALRWKLEAKSQTDTNQVWNFNIPTSLRPTVVWFKSEIGTKIKKITEKLEDIAKERFELGLKEDVGGKSIKIRERLPTSSLVDESGVYGREEDKEKIIKLLLSDEANGNEVCVIPIVGMGGIGKTTLAQLVYNDKGVDEYFDMKAWACVSQEFDVLRVTNTILESITGNQCNFTDLNLLQVRLKDAMSGKKFLLVLDDVWNQNYSDWDVLQNPFISGAQGSKIIVTTRSVIVSSIMSNVAPHHLGVLSNEDCQSLFVKHAFGNKNSDTQSKLERIVKKIVDKCKGLPLAAKTIGGLLRSKVDEEEWEDILNSEIWELTEEENGILPALRLSYHHLPAHLKRCFAYCSIFPKDYKFQKEELVLLWMAEDFVQPKRNKRMEDVGGTYFDDLLQRSFFQKSGRSKGEFVMHDLVNDLARFVSREICFRLEGDDSYRISEKTRHLSYHSDTYDMITKFEDFYEGVCLRTFLPLDLQMGARYLPKQVLHELFSRLRCLRVLCLKYYNITELPDSIGNLRHLRYLDLSHTKIERLPESTCTLNNLQTLLLRYCRSLTELPQNMGNLVNLRHLNIHDCAQLEKMPLGIGKLTSLETLTKFVVSKNSGSLIRELRDMSDLRGTLHISMLENIVNDMDAMKANIRNKQHIGKLKLEWSSYDNNIESRVEEVEENILECLQPHRDLKELTIAHYSGRRFPDWIGDPSFSNLVILSIQYCRKCKSLPPLGQLPSLQDLTIHGMKGVKCVGRELCGNGSIKQFGSLKKLLIYDMPEWEEWTGIEEEECIQFPCLLELSISSCPKLRKVSHHFPALLKLRINACEDLIAFPKLLSRGNSEEGEEFSCLRDLVIKKCPNLLPSLVQLPRLPMLRTLVLNSCDEKVLESMVEVTSLTSLRISGIPKLAFLPKGFLQHLTSLEELYIYDCGELMAFSEDFGIQHLTSLRHLEIYHCPKFQFVSMPNGEVGLPTSLEYLEIKDCEKMENLPPRLHNLTSLRKLVITHCQGLVSLSQMTLPATLKFLKIGNCTNLKFLPEEMMSSNTSLEKLMIGGCPSLTSFPRILGLSTTTTIKLMELHILDCQNLEPLPENLRLLTSLQLLRISGCPRLVSFPEGWFPITHLRVVSIRGCKNLNRLPNQLHSLTSIQKLEIKNCPNLVSFPERGLPTNCKSLRIMDCEKLEPLTSMALQRLTSLRDFTVGGFSGPISFPKWMLPTTLTSLYIKRLLNLEALSDGLHNLTSIQRLTISECPKLASLPEDGLPTTLRSICIWKCPLLSKRCQKETGEDWPKIAHIPCIGLDDGGIYSREVQMQHHF